MNAMTPKMKAAWRKMVGAAFLWVALAALVATTTSSGGRGAVIATVGFVSFALGLALFTDGMKREIVDEVRRSD